MAYTDDEKKKDLVSDYMNNYANVNINTQKLIDTYLQKANQQYNWDPNASKLYQDAVKRYSEMGQRAMQDTMGKAAALTGGYGSSYATVAGQQAYNQYMQQLPEVERQIRAQDYAEWQNNLNNALNAANLALNIDNLNYTRGFNERQFQFQKDQADRSQSNWEKQFEYQNLLDDRAQSNWQLQFDYNKSQDAADRAYRQQLFEYQKQQDALAQSNWEKQFEQNKLAQEYSKWLNEQKLQQEAAAQNDSFVNKAYEYARETIINEINGDVSKGILPKYDLSTQEGKEKLRDRIAAYYGILGAEGISRLFIDLGINPLDIASEEYWDNLSRKHSGNIAGGSTGGVRRYTSQ